MAEVLGGLFTQAGADLHVACPGKVTRWDSSIQQADVQPLLKRGYLDEQGDRQIAQLPVVCNVPVVLPHAGGLAALKTYLDALTTALAGVTFGGYAAVWPPPSSALPAVPSFADLVMPISVGDPGLLVFADGSLDVWLSHGGLVDPLNDRHHALSDAVFIPGLRSFNNAISVPA
jgi:hypothetical protein